MTYLPPDPRIALIESILKHADAIAAEAAMLRSVAPTGHLSMFNLPPQRGGRVLPEGVHLHPNPSECCNEMVYFLPDEEQDDPVGWDYCVKPPDHEGEHEWPWRDAYERGDLA